MSHSLSRHDQILRAGIEANAGRVFKTVGDAFCAAFASPEAALDACLAVQAGLAAETWRIEGGILVRMAIHSGEAEERDEDYFGPALNRVARLLSLAYGGQILLSLATEELLEDRLPKGVSLRLLGRYRLKDLSRPETVYQVEAPGLHSDFPPIKSLDGKPHNLPLEPTPFIGREAEVATIVQAFSDPDCRLLSILGPGGVGKTRLSIQTGAELLDDYAGGVWFVDLSDCKDAEASVRTINRVLAVKEGPGRGPLESLEDFLGSRRYLLIFDNLEQASGLGALVSDLLSACPGLAILATSRVALRIRWERQLPLPPLAIPVSAGATVLSLSHYDAVRLFVERARAAKPSFRIDDRNAPAVAQICVRLDGIPLAIELAAARAKAFSPDEILARFEADPDFLDARGSDLPDRQSTLRSVAAWSYGLLAKAEKAAYRALGAFAGGFTLYSAEAVLATTDLGKGGARRIPDLLASLVDKSLVVREELAQGSRYRLLETLRVYARESLEASPEGALVLAAHSERYRLLAAGFQVRAGKGAGEAELLSGIDVEYPEYTTAFQRLVASGDIPAALEIAGGLARFREIRGLLAEGIEDLRRVLGIPCPGLSGIALAQARFSLAELLRRKGEYEASLEEYGKALDLARAAGAEDLAQLARVCAGWAHFRLGQNQLAQETWSQLASTVKEDRLQEPQARLAAALAEEGLGVVALVEGRYEEAKPLLDSACSSFRALGELTRAHVAILNSGVAAFRMGKVAEAKAAWERAARVAEELGSVKDRLVAKNNIACAFQAEGDHEGALEVFREIEGAARLSTPSQHFMVVSGLTESLLALGFLDEAENRARECQILAEEDGIRIHHSWAERILGDILCARGDPSMAVQCYDRAEAHARATGDVYELELIAASRRKIEVQ